jgi:hypothetical protein
MYDEAVVRLQAPQRRVGQDVAQRSEVVLDRREVTEITSGRGIAARADEQRPRPLRVRKPH